MFFFILLILLFRLLFVGGNSGAHRQPDASDAGKRIVCAEADKYRPRIGPSYPGDAHPTDKQQQWAMATCAMLFSLNGDSHDILGGKTNRVDQQRESLRRWWGIDDRDSLLGALARLEAGGHRRLYDEWVQRVEGLSPRELRRLVHRTSRDPATSNRLDVVLATRAHFSFFDSLTGWDYSRYVSLCRWGVRAGYLKEEEAWSLIMPVARLLQQTYVDWDQLAVNYIEGRRFWSLTESAKDSERLAANLRFHRLNRYAPWRRLPWSQNLQPESPSDDGSAEFRLGRAHFYCFGDPDGNTAAGKEAGVRFFHAAAAKGNIDAMYLLGACYADGEGVAKDPQEAYRWFREAADRGDALAQHEVGMAYLKGHGVPRDLDLASEWGLRALVNQRGPQVDAFAGWCYEQGLGVPKSMPMAVELYEHAAYYGETWALNNLGDCYAKGKGVPRDMRKAARLFAESARAGDADGQYRWAQCLENGDAGYSNLTEAAIWHYRSSMAGEPRAARRLEELGYSVERGRHADGTEASDSILILVSKPRRESAVPGEPAPSNPVSAGADSLPSPPDGRAQPSPATPEPDNAHP